MPRAHDTIAALATPPGTAAISVIRASGPDAYRLAREIFGAAPPPRTVQRGDYRDLSGNVVDDVLFTSFVAEASYTGEDALEVSAHGNPYIAQRILEDLLARGCRPAGPGEFTQRAFLNGRMDLSQAEAVMDLIHARSEKALAAANRQLRGALGLRMQELVSGLLAVLARVEAGIDFPEEDIPAEDRLQLGADLDRLATGTGRLLATSHYGALLRDGIRTVIVGAPNAGKSSLLNRLVGRDRALVSPEPGTTRDFIEERIALGPHLLRLTDTAGLNPSPTPLEKLGMEKTLECAADADLLLLVYDVTGEPPALPVDSAAGLREKSTIAVANKMDLLPPGSQQAEICGVRTVCVSALNGTGIEKLEAAIVTHADSLLPGTGDDTVAINARHAAALTRAQAGLKGALQKLTTAAPSELLASDLRDVLDAYGEISGKVDNERMLDRLFATFCIGK